MRQEQKNKPWENNQSFNERMTFGEALEALKNGKCISRPEWDGAYLYLSKGSFDIHEQNEIAPQYIEHIPVRLFEIGDKDTWTRLPNVNYSNSTGVYLCGYSPSQHDMFAEDWQVYERDSIID